jgi:two-component system, OmpR family, sensor histidine kinase KdpD
MNAVLNGADWQISGAAGASKSDSRGRMIVTIAPDENPDFAEQLVRAGRRYAVALNLDWTVVCVETPPLLSNPKLERDSRLEVFRLAESLGAETVTLDAAVPAVAVAAYARLHGIQTIVVGAAGSVSRPRFLRRSTMASLLRQCGGAEIVVIGREADRAAGDDGALTSSRVVEYAHWLSYAAALGITVLCTLAALPLLNHVDIIDIVMIYMLGATLVALRLGRGPTVLTAVANVGAFDFLFVPPRFSFYVSDSQYLITFGVMLGVAIIIANLVAVVRKQSIAAGARAHTSAALYALSRELAAMRDGNAMAATAARHVASESHGAVAVLLRDKQGRLHQPDGQFDQKSRRRPEATICDWVAEHRQRAGLGGEAYPAERAMYLPLVGSQECIGVLALWPLDVRRALLPEALRLTEALAGTLALALERVHLADVAEAARVAAERAALRSTLLASISHDLRTPLSAIAGAGSMMAHESFALDAHRVGTLGRLIEDKARDMTELLSNVLELMRLETGPGTLKRDWHSLEDLVGQALRQNQGRLALWRVQVDLSPQLPMLRVDGGLIVQMLSNFLENCIKYTPAGTVISISASPEQELMRIVFEDNGPGFGDADPELLFDKFARGRLESNISGVGLGLSICRAIARLHLGDVSAAAAQSGGARFEIALPIDAEPEPGTYGVTS